MNKDIPSFDKGDLARLTARFHNGANVAVDPSAVLLQVTTPAGVTTLYTYGVGVEVLKDSVGHYHRDVDANASGVWSYRWRSTGSGQAAEEGRFIVAPTIY